MAIYRIINGKKTLLADVTDFSEINKNIEDLENDVNSNKINFDPKNGINIIETSNQDNSKTVKIGVIKTDNVNLQFTENREIFFDMPDITNVKDLTSYNGAICYDLSDSPKEIYSP